MTRTERTEILPEPRPEISDLKFTRTENDPYWTELNPNFFFPKSFFFSRKVYWTKNQLTWNRPDPKLNRLETEHEPNHVDPKWPDPKLTRPELKPNDPFARPTQVTLFTLKKEKISIYTKI